MVRLYRKKAFWSFIFLWIGVSILSSECLGQETTDDYELINCVMPGDANNDGKANISDVLRLGIAYGMAGPPRSAISNEWAPQPAINWSTNQYDGLNYKHTDSNGDGIVALNDLAAISLNYDSEIDNTVLSFPWADYQLSVNIQNESIGAGDTVVATISLDNITGGDVTDVYGLAFRLLFDKELVKEETASFSSENSWLGAENELLKMTQQLPNRVETAITRTDQVSVSGDGDIITFTAVMEDILLGKSLDSGLEITVQDVRLIDAQGNLHPVSVSNDNQPIEETNETTGIFDLKSSSAISVFPNPTTDEVFVELNTNSPIDYIQITNQKGQIVKSLSLQFYKSNQLRLPLYELSGGIYLLTVFAKDVRTTQTLIIER